MSAKANNPEAEMPGQMSPKQILQFFVLLPLAIGLFFGAARIGAYEFVTIGHHIAYMALFTMLAWACYGLGSTLAAIILRPWQPSLVVVLVAGYLAGGFALWWPLRDLLNIGFEPFLMPGSSFGVFWPPPPDKLGWYIVISLQGLAGWILANWLDFRYRRVPRFGFAPAVEAGALPPSVDGIANQQRPNEAAEIQSPRLHDRLPEKLQEARIYALEAEEHYTKIHTSKGNTLILMRFSDAIAEMEPQPGLQVHRSYWVSREDVACLQLAGRRLILQMHGGLEVPVSRSYRVQVRKAGFAQTDGPGDGR